LKEPRYAFFVVCPELAVYSSTSLALIFSSAFCVASLICGGQYSAVGEASMQDGVLERMIVVFDCEPSGCRSSINAVNSSDYQNQ